jgi:hypothetical protein
MPEYPGQMNLTLVAFYKEKPGAFLEFIRWCQNAVASQLPGTFRPYEPGQIHATIVGLEGLHRDGEVLNANYARLGESRCMDLMGLIDYLGNTPLLPLRVRFGGFRLEDEYPFTSQGQHPYHRSFTLQESNMAVAVGWPEYDGGFSENLDHLRRAFNQYNVLHKYHRTANDVDNDLFLVLGKVEPGTVKNVSPEAVSEVVRSRIAAIEPVYLDITPEDLSLVAYLDDELPVETSVNIALSNARDDIEHIKALYMAAT